MTQRFCAHASAVLLFASTAFATILPAPTVTSSSAAYQGTYVRSNAVNHDNAEFLSTAGTSTFLEFDFGSDVTIDGFVLATLVDPSRTIGAHRLIFDTDPDSVFSEDFDTVVTFNTPRTGSQGQGFINRFAPVTARKVRWEVRTLVGTPALVGATEVAFLNTAAGASVIGRVKVIGSATPFSSQFAAANAANGIAGIGNVAGVEYASAGLGTNAYVDFDFGTPSEITGFDLFDRLFASDRVTSFNLIFSNNADMSSPVVTKSYTKGSTWTKSDDFAAVNARFVRFDVTGGSNNTGLGDISFYTNSGSPEITLEQPVGTSIANNVIAWGESFGVFSNSSYVPPDTMEVKDIVAGDEFALALKTDGSLSIWGYNNATGSNYKLPDGLANVVSVATSGYLGMAIKDDGSIVEFGDLVNASPSARKPSGLTNVSKIALGGQVGIALKNDGTVQAWGYTYNSSHQAIDAATSVPAGLSDVVDVAVCWTTFWALKGDGTVVGWGYFPTPSTPTPTPPSGLVNVKAISAGGTFMLALKNDGTVVAFGGRNVYGERNVPSNLTSVTAIAAGGIHALALKDDGTMVGWGSNLSGQLDVPSNFGKVGKIAAGGSQSIALGTTTIGFSSVAEGSTSAAKTLTIRNTGINALSIFGVTLTGGNTSEFVVNTTGLSGSVAPGATTSFTVAFAPSTQGARTATLRIESNDNDESLRDLTLTGVGKAASAPELASPTKSAITAVSATLGGELTNDGGLTITERGIAYSLVSANTNPRIGGTGVTKVIASGTSVGTFTVNVTGLTPGSVYNFAPYAINSLGTGYGPVGLLDTPNNNANLSAIALSSGTLSPAFVAGTTSYTVSVANAVTDLSVTATVAQSNASFTINGTTAISGEPSSSLPLNIGANVFNIVVTAQDGTTKTYTITVTRADFPNTAPSFAMPGFGTVADAGMWIPRLNDTNRTWSGVAMSSDGSKLAACAVGGSIWTSTDAGVTWTERTSAGARNWNGICSSTDGTKLAAISSAGKIYTSADSGATWTERNSGVTGDWGVVTCSADGLKLFASNHSYGGFGYTSTNQGAAWTTRSTMGRCLWAASSADGNKLAAFVSGGSLQVSSNAGAAWTVTPFSHPGMEDIAMSADGTKLFLAVNEGNAGQMQRSLNGGTSFTKVGPNLGWLALACSSDGSKVFAVTVDGSVWFSTDTGSTWAKLPGNQPGIPSFIKCSADGTRLVTASNVNPRIIHTITLSTSSAVTAYADDPAQTIANFATNISPGTRTGEASQVVSFDLTSNLTSLFSSQPAISSNGTLTFTPNGTAGTATVSVFARDNGGTLDGGVDASASKNFNIVILPALDLNLTSLTISAGTLSPSFASGTTSYTVSVPDTTSSVTLTPTVSNALNNVSVNGSRVASGNASAALPLSYGANTLNVTVSNADGSRSKVYTVVVTRAPVVPTVTQPQFSGVAATQATLGGRVTADGGSAITERGIVYALAAANNNPSIGGTGVTKITSAMNDVGAFNIAATGLSENSDYSFKAYATNAIGTGYTSVGIFKTPVVPRPEITQIAPIAGLIGGGSTLTLTGRYFNGATSVTIGGVAATGINVVSDGSLTCAIPSGTAGAKDIVVTTGIGGGTARNAFRYVDLTVTTAADAGAGTLREALSNAADVSGADTITFAPALSGKTIAVQPSVVQGTGNDSAFVIDDAGGVTIDASALADGITIKSTIATENCRAFYLRSGSLTLRAVTIEGCGGTIPGGAIFSSGTLSLERCTLNNNRATTSNGGAIYNDNGTLTIVQSTLAQNTAGLGGAIFNDGSLLVRHSTIAANSADADGGGICMAKAMTVENSIVAGNTASRGLDIFNDAALTRTGGNIVPVLHTLTGLTGAGAILTVDPLLSGLAPNGGPTRTMLPQSGSPAINGSIGSSVTSDQRGVSVTGTPDIGAVDVPPSAPVLGAVKFLNTLSATANVEGIVTSTGGATLTGRGFVYALTSANASPTIGGTGVTTVSVPGPAAGGFSGGFYGLIAGASYSFRAFAMNSVATTYSSVATFSTLSDNADLSGLGLSSGALSPAFAPTTTSYTASVPAGTTSVTLTITPAQSKAKFEVNGTANTTMPLSIGANVVTIVVIAENSATTKTYTLTVTRPASPPTLGVATQSLSGATRVIECGAVDNGGSNITAQGVVFALAATNNNPQIGGTGVTQVAGSLNGSTVSANVTTMAAGSTYAFALYATNSVGTSYSTVGVVTIPSGNADLSALTISSGTLAPAFASGTLTYSASTAATFINVTPTAAMSGSVVKVNGSVVGAGSPSRDIPLVAGINTLTILVTAPDGTTTKTYTLAVSRAAAVPVLASAVTKAALQSTTATLGGNITDDNGGTIAERGIVYALTSANNNPRVGGSGVTKVPGSGTSTGVFTVPVSGLTASSAYSFVAYATNSAGAGYSGVGAFTTGNGLANTAPSFDMPTSVVQPAGVTWTQVTTAPGSIYTIDVSDDGTRLAAGAFGASPAYSIDGGVNWITSNHTEPTGSTWPSIALSNSGQYVFAGVDGLIGYTVGSSNSGANLTRRHLSNTLGAPVLACSDDGQRVVAAYYGGRLVMSKNFGVNWDEQTTGLSSSGRWLSVACSGDGLRGIAGSDSELFTFTIGTDGKATWTKRNGAGQQRWTSLSMSKDGAVILGTAGNGSLWMSTNGGVTWSPRLEASAQSWSASTCSADGKFLAAAVDGAKVWTSSDGGTTWTLQAGAPVQSWTRLSATADGMTLYGSHYTGLWKSVGGSVPYKLVVNPGSGVQSIAGFCKNISAGASEPNQTVSFNVTTDNNALFRKLPTISADGTLSFAPGVTAGQATISVTAQDDGGTAGGGVDASATKTFVIELRGDDSIGTWSTAAWTGDASTGIVADRTMWAYHFGSNVATNVNSTAVVGVPTSAISDENVDVTGATQVLTSDTNNLSSGTSGSGLIARSFVWGGDPTEVKLKGLVPGTSYVLNFLTVGWENAGQRVLHFGSGSDASQVDQGQLGNDNGLRVTYSFTANLAERTVRITQANENGQSFHLYGLALVIGSGSTNQVPTDISLSNSSIAENNSAGEIVGLFSTTDADATQAHSYALVPGTGDTDNVFFAIRGNALAMTIVADRENKATYAIRVRSTDNGFPKRSVEKAMSITITDVPEPATDIALEPGTIDEGTPRFTTFGVLRATGDPDTTSPIFTLVNGGADNASFSIVTDGTTSSLRTLRTDVDYETKKEYNIRVRVTDRSGLAPFEKDIRIPVNDVNDAPTLSDITAPQTINEDGKLTLNFTVSDAETAADKLIVTATSKNAAVVPTANLQISGGATRTLTATPLPNVSGTTTITVTVSDGGRAQSLNFLLNVLPVNDAPSFNLPPSIALSPTQAGAGLANFVTDINVGPLETQSYTITATAANTTLFGVGSGVYFADGKLYAIPSPGHTGTSDITVTLRDNGGADRGGVDSVSKTFKITYQNNSSPQNLTLSGNSVAENSPVGTLIGTLSATDPDVGNTLSYSLVAGSNDNASFTLDAVNKTIKTKVVPDFETKSAYNIAVRVTDNGIPAASIDKTFTITVTDANEPATSFTANTPTLLENQGPEVAVPITFTVADPERSQTHTFSLVAGAGDSDNAKFKFVNNQLLTADNLDYEARNALSIRVRATDNGNPPQSFEKAFAINVANVNEPPTDVRLLDSSNQVASTVLREGVFVYNNPYVGVPDPLPQGTFIWGTNNLVEYDKLNAAFGVVGLLDAINPESGQTFRYEIVPESGTDYQDFYIFAEQTSKTNVQPTGRYFLRRARESVFDYECPTKRTYTLKIKATDNGLNGVTTKLTNGYTYTSYAEPRFYPASFTKTFTFTISPQDEEPMLGGTDDVKVEQRPGAKLVDINYLLHDPDTATLNVTMQWSSDNGATWNTPSSLTGEFGTVPGTKRMGERKRPVNDRDFRRDQDMRRMVWNVGRDWNNQFTEQLRVRITVNGTLTSTSPAATVDTRGDGPLKVFGYVINKLTGRPYIPLAGSPPIKVTLGNRSTDVRFSDTNAQMIGRFDLTNCAPGRLTVSHPLFVVYEKDVEAPPSGQLIYMPDLGLTPDTDPPVVHQIFMTQAGGVIGAKDRGIALAGFGVKSSASIDMNWGKARRTGVFAAGDQLNVYLNANPRATAEELLAGAKAFQTVSGYTAINFKTAMIDYDKLFKPGTQEGLNNITVIAKNELGQWSLPEVKPIYFLPLPSIIDKLAPAKGSTGRKVFSNDQLGFDFGTFDLKKVIDYPVIGKWGVEFSTSGSFDYTMSDGNWELAYRGGDLNMFGNQYLVRKINARPGYKSPYEEKEDEDDEPLDPMNIFLPKDQFKVVDGKIELKSLFSETDDMPRIALYMGDREIEAAFFAAASGGVSANKGFDLPEIEGALIVRFDGPVAEVNLAQLLGVPKAIGKYISPTLELSSKIDLGGSAKIAPTVVPVILVPVYKPKEATLSGKIDLKLALSLDVDIAGIEGYVGGSLYGRLGYPSPLLRELNGRIYAGYEWYVGFLDGGGEITLAQFKYQNADDPALKPPPPPMQGFALSNSLPTSNSNQLNLTLPSLSVVGRSERPVGPMKRRWRDHGVEQFALMPVASPSTANQVKLAQSGLAAAPPATQSGISKDLAMFNRMGRAATKPDPRLQAIISSDPLPAQAQLPLLENIFPRSRQALAESSGKLMLVYARDTGAANAIQFTEIAYTYYNGSSWTVPGAIAADPRGQTNPQVKADGTGNFVATWTRLKDLSFDGTGGLDAQAAQMELVTATWNATTGTWSTPIALTDNNALDHKAKLAGPIADGDLLLTWTRNHGNQLDATATAADDVLMARWDAATQSWGPASLVVSGLTHVTSSDFDASGATAVFIYTTDADGNAQDASDADVHSITWSGGSWGAPVDVTADSVADKTARVIVQPNGDVFTLWNHAGDMVMDKNASGTPSIVREKSDGGGFTDFAFTAGANGNLLLLWRGDIDGNPDAFYRIYDSFTQSWSEDSRLSNDADSESSFTPLWDAQGNLIIAYHNTQLLRTTKDVTLDDGTQAVVEGAIVPGRTDLLLTRRLLTTDLNVRNLTAAGSTWGPGSTITLSAELINSGNLPITDASISFYDGNPGTGGALITTLTAPGSLVGAATFSATFDWTMPADTTTQHRIYAVADAANAVEEFDETNNSASRLIGGPDLKLEYLAGSTSTDGSARLGVRVSNIGSPASPVATVKLWSSPVRGGAPLAVETVSVLEPSTNAEVVLPLAAGALAPGDHSFEIVVNEENLGIEPNQGNNSTIVTLTMAAPASDATGLSDLAVTGATLSPFFATGTTAYSTSVPFDQTSVTVVPTALHFGSTITVNGAPVDSGNASEAIALNPGSTEIIVEVTSQSGAKRLSYSVMVHRGVSSSEDSGNGSLRALINAAATRAGPDVIALGREMDGRTIRLSGPIWINDPGGVILDGSALKDGVTIEGSGNHSLFEVAANSSLTLICVTLTKGRNAIYNEGTLRLERCTMMENTTPISGGAINNAATGKLTVMQSTFAFNTAGADGGAIFNMGMASLLFSTFADNSATGAGGAVRSWITLSMENCVFARNTSTFGLDVDASGSLPNTKLICRGVNIARVTHTGSSTDGPEPLVLDPLLSELGNYGGPTNTFVPLVGSPAIDQSVVVSAPPAIDQRGYPRTLGSNPDLGSTEGRILIVTTALDELNPTDVLGAGYSLREAVRDAEEGATILFDRAIFNGSTATTNTITLIQGPLNPARNVTLVGTDNPGGITILSNLSITTQPAPQTIGLGGSATFSVAPRAVNGGIAYQWRRDGVNIDGAVSSSYRITNAAETQAGVYDVVLDEAEASGAVSLVNVTFDFGQVVSQPASLTVGTPVLKMMRSPSHAMLALGASHTLSVVAIGPVTPALTYQWAKDGKNLAGATQANYTILNAALSNAGAYTCVVKSGALTLTSEVAQVAVVDTKAKTSNLLVGGTFTPVLSFGGNNLSLAWKRDGIDLGQTTNTFTIKPLTTANAGLYTCAVTGPGGTIENGFNNTLNVSGTAPTLGAITLPPAYIGQSYYYKLPVLPIAGAPATSFSVSGALPTGIKFDAATGGALGSSDNLEGTRLRAEVQSNQRQRQQPRSRCNAHGRDARSIRRRHLRWTGSAFIVERQPRWSLRSHHDRDRHLQRERHARRAC